MGVAELQPRSSFASLSWRSLAGLMLVVALLSGCGLGSGGTQGSFDYSGSWRGSVTDEANGAGTFIVTISQTNLTLAGTWHVVMSADAARQAGGTWAGQVFVGEQRDLLEASLTPALAGECSYKLTLARSNESLTGDYSASGSVEVCNNLTRGTLSLSKQP